MMLLVDIGNTFLKWACLEDGSFIDEGEILHIDEDILADVFFDAWQDIPAPDGVLVANVAGEEFASELNQWLNNTWQVHAQYAVTEQHAYGVHNAYEQPQQLGVDRWLAIVAAWNQEHRAVCVIDCGTALTVDAVDAEGQHLGGLIAPGLGMMRDCLMEGTQGIDYDIENSTEHAGSLLAHNTQDGVDIGSLYAVLAFIDRVYTDLLRELGDDVQFIVTGGDAPDIVPLLACEVIHRPQLVLEGLALQLTESA